MEEKHRREVQSFGAFGPAPPWQRPALNPSLMVFMVSESYNLLIAWLVPHLPAPVRSRLGAHSYHLIHITSAVGALTGNSQGFRSQVPGPGDKDQICFFLYRTPANP